MYVFMPRGCAGCGGDGLLVGSVCSEVNHTLGVSHYYGIARD